jgi:hypothetical protein
MNISADYVIEEIDAYKRQFKVASIDRALELANMASGDYDVKFVDTEKGPKFVFMDANLFPIVEIELPLVFNFWATDLASWNKEKVLLYDYVGSSRICINYPLQRAVPVVQNAIAFLNLIQDTFLKADFVMKRL